MGKLNKFCVLTTVTALLSTVLRWSRLTIYPFSTEFVNHFTFYLKKKIIFGKKMKVFYLYDSKMTKKHVLSRKDKICEKMASPARKFRLKNRFIK